MNIFFWAGKGGEHFLYLPMYLILLESIKNDRRYAHIKNLLSASFFPREQRKLHNRAMAYIGYSSGEINRKTGKAQYKS